MNISSKPPTGRVESLTAHVAPDLAAEVRRLAEAGERSVSRQVAIAVKEHIQTARAFETCWGPRAENPKGAAGPGRSPGVDAVAAEGEAA